ncbi:MAG: hypothetical protein WC375_02990 [Methanomassiliicoccales archaeon]|jgi:hypothetical protein
MEGTAPDEAPKAEQAQRPKDRRKRLLIALGVVGIVIMMTVAAAVYLTRAPDNDSDNDGVIDVLDNFPDGDGMLLFTIDQTRFDDWYNIVFRLSIETTGDGTFDDILESSTYSFLKNDDDVWSVEINVPDDENNLMFRLQVIEVSQPIERYVNYGLSPYGSNLDFSLYRDSSEYEMPIYWSFSGLTSTSDAPKCSLIFSFSEITE